MKAPAYKIKFKDNTHAVLAEKLFEEGPLSPVMPADVRDGNTLIFSKEWWDMEGYDKDDIQNALEDVCCVGEMDYTPEIEEVEWDFSLDEYERVQDMKDELGES